MNRPRLPAWLLPRFGLRGMFVVLTIVCCWLAWQSRVVHQRRAVRNELQANPAFQFITADVWAQNFPQGNPGQRVASVPLLRRWFGDEAIQEVWFTRYVPEFSAEKLSRVAEAFPESEMREQHPEPCHPGCFPHGTAIDTPQGRRPIESIRVNDLVVTILPSGDTEIARVQSIFVTANRLWQVDTDDGSLLTTQTQPLCSTAQVTVAAGDLRPGDVLLRRRDQGVYSVNVLNVSPTDRVEKVINLVLGNSQVFVAEGFLARSKPPAQGDTPFPSHAAR